VAVTIREDEGEVFLPPRLVIDLRREQDQIYFVNLKRCPSLATPCNRLEAGSGSNLLRKIKERSFASPEVLLSVGLHGLLRIKFTS